MKRIITGILFLTMVLSISVTAFASYEGTVTVSLDKEIAFTPKQIAEQKKIDERLRNEAAMVSPKGLVDMITYSVSVVSCQQQNDDYCGPACTKMAYEALTGDYSHNQDWFANKIGTTGEGSYSGTIANKLLELTGYNYSLANMKSQTKEDFFNNISHSLQIGCPVIANVKSIPGRGYTVKKGHFILIYSVTWDSYYGYTTAYYTYIDPHYNSDYYGIYTISNGSMYDAVGTNAGNYVRAV